MGKRPMIQMGEKVEDFIPDTQPVTVVDKEDDFDLGAEDHRKKILELKDSIGKNSFELCRLLGYAREMNRFKSWGYDTYREYAHKELGVPYSKAKFMADLWLRVGKTNPVLLDKISSEGWDKAKQLVNVVTDENADEWMEKAKHLNADDLKKEVKSYMLSLVPNEPHEALSKESEVTGTPVEEVKKNMSFSFSHDEYMTLCKALTHVQDANPEIQNKGSVVALICSDYLGSAQDGVGMEYVIGMLKKFESVYPVRFVAVNTEDQNVVYGENFISELKGGNN